MKLDAWCFRERRNKNGKNSRNGSLGMSEAQTGVTERRALALGLDALTPMALKLSAGDNAHTILALVADATNHRMPAARPAAAPADQS